MVNETTQRSPALQPRGLPSNSLLRLRIEQAVALGMDPDDAEMNLSILNRRPDIDNSPAPAPAPETGTQEPEQPAEVQPGSLTVELLGRILAQLIDVVGTMAAPPGKPRSIVATVSNATADYVTVASWIIPAGWEGQIEEIAFTSDTPATAQWRLTIGGVEQWTDLMQANPLSIPFPADNRLQENLEVLVEMKSDGILTIVGDASISGIEREP